MATFATNRAFGAMTQNRATGAFFGFFAALASWNDRRLTRKQLGKLTDRELDDIGLHRSDIEMLTK